MDGKDNEHIYKLPNYKPRYEINIPEYTPSFKEVSKQMRINADIIMKEISDHVDREIERFKQHLCEIKVPDAFTQPPLHDGLIDPGSKRLDKCNVQRKITNL